MNPGKQKPQGGKNVNYQPMRSIVAELKHLSQAVKNHRKSYLRQQEINRDVENANQRRWTRSDKINAILAFVAFLAVVYSAMQVNIGKESALAAKDAARIADSSLRLSQKQFEAQTKPILQIGDLLLTVRRGDTKVMVDRLTIKNLRDYPVNMNRMILATRMIRISFDNPNFDSLLDAAIDAADSVPRRSLYITKEAPVTFADVKITLKEDIKTLETEFDMAKVGIMKFYLIGQVIYINEADNLPWRYFFCLKINDPWNCSPEVANAGGHCSFLPVIGVNERYYKNY